MKYYSEKLNKLFDTEKELLDAEANSSRLGFWKLHLSNAIDELARKNEDLEKAIDDCVKEVGEDLCDKLLDEIFEDRATIKEDTQKVEQKKHDKKITQEQINNLLKEDGKNPLITTWNGFFSLINKIFGEDE